MLASVRAQHFAGNKTTGDARHFEQPRGKIKVFLAVDESMVGATVITDRVKEIFVFTAFLNFHDI